MTEGRRPLENVVLTAVAVDALELAAARRGGVPLSTTALLVGVLDANLTGGWDDVQLAATFVAQGDVDAYPDPEPDVAGTWHNVPLTSTAVKALAAAVRIASDYHLVPLPPAVLVLGLLSSPASGASRALLAESELVHAELLALVQDDVLDVTLEGLDVAGAAVPPVRRRVGRAIGRRIRSGGKDAPEAPPNVQRVEWQQRDTGALGLMIDALESPAADDEMRELSAAMLLDADSIREAARGTTDLEDEPAATAVERAKRRLDEGELDPAALVAAAAVGASPRITEVLRRLGLKPPEVAAQFAELRLRREGSRAAGNRVFFATILNGLTTLTTTVFVVLAAVESSASIWKLLFIAVVWTGYPQSGAALGAVIGCVLALVVSPVAGICHLVGIPADANQAAAERDARLARTGVHLSLAEQRRVTLRFLNARARRYQLQRQRVRANLRAVLEDRAAGS